MDHGTALVVSYLLTALVLSGEVAILFIRRRQAWKALKASGRMRRASTPNLKDAQGS